MELRNVSETTYEYVEVHVTPMDGEDDEKGKFYADTRSANVDTLEPDATWEFDVEFTSEDVGEFDRYEIWVTGQENL